MSATVKELLFSIHEESVKLNGELVEVCRTIGWDTLNTPAGSAIDVGRGRHLKTQLDILSDLSNLIKTKCRDYNLDFHGDSKDA